jgi:NAD(P)-dependent dehydrogenase (short-subunit alcohol dehydrogenase family)
VINAAGIVGFGTVESTTVADAARLMRVNHLAPAELISRLVPRLVESTGASTPPRLPDGSASSGEPHPVPPSPARLDDHDCLPFSWSG